MDASQSSYPAQMPNDTVESVKQQVKKNREQTTDTIETLYFVAMKSYAHPFVIASSYTIKGHTFMCDVFESDETTEKSLTQLFGKIKHRHQETFKIKSLFEDNLKETMHHPIESIEGYMVSNEYSIKKFTISSPREKTRLEWVKDGLFSKKEVPVENEKQPDEIEADDLFYQCTISPEELPARELIEAKSMIVKATHRNFSLSDEMFAYKKLERVWDEWKKKGEAALEEVEEFLEALSQFKESCSPEMEPLVDQFFRMVGSKRSVIHQYELLRKHDVVATIYFD